MTSQCIPYIVTEAFCIVFALSVLFRLDKSIGSEHEVRELKNMIFAYLSMLVTDIFWDLFENDVIKPNRYVILAVSAMLVMSISLGCYFWFMFIQDRLHPTRPTGRRKTFLFAVPVLIVILLDVISIFTGLLFYINDHGHYESTSLFLFQGTVNYFYTLSPTVACILRAVRARSKAERREFATYSAYIIAPAVGGMLEDVFPLVPVLGLSIFVIIQILFLMIQNMRIYNDALTDLNNRRRLAQFLEVRLPKATAERPVTIFMMDINRFKSINDTYGHIEGDNALRRFAGILKKAAPLRGAFIARYGGDEFCLVSDASDRRPDEVAREIQELAAASGGTDRYPLTVSVGYTVCEVPCGPGAALKAADDMLYARKKKWHEEND